MKQGIFLTIVLLVSSLSGCFSSDEESLEEFPEFSLVDEAGNTQELGMYENTPFVAYFSASWCGHCKPVLEALDDTIPEGNLMVFNKDAREEYSDMNEWKDRMESELERNLSHPFIHAPALSETLNVTGIPTMFFVNSDGLIEYSMTGLNNQSTMETYWKDIE